VDHIVHDLNISLAVSLVIITISILRIKLMGNAAGEHQVGACLFPALDGDISRIEL